MNSKRISYLMAGMLAVLVLGIVGSAYAANSVLQKQAAKLAGARLDSEVLRKEQASLAKAKQDIQTYRELNTIAKTVVPQDKDQAQTVREIIKIAGESGISPSSITFPASNLGTTATGAVAAGSSSRDTLTQLTPVKGLSGVYVLPITITQNSSAPVPYDRFITFLNKMEQNRRTAQVSSIQLQPDPQNRGSLSFTLTVEEYLKP